MTPEEHNKYLGIAHLVYGGIYALIMLATTVFIIAISRMSDHGRGGPPDGFVLLMGIFMLVFFAAFTIPAFVAGYGLLKRKRWAKIWGIISGILAATSFPIGTAVCIYSVWFLLGDKGKEFYTETAADSETQTFSRWSNRQQSTLPEGVPEDWQRSGSADREKSYVPPPQMPNWRDDE
ncbi:MAG TPA: hypothetical protein VGB17_07255 [Pyrinomonadaceae bacterium]|jgi:hypothetical protein